MLAHFLRIIVNLLRSLRLLNNQWNDYTTHARRNTLPMFRYVTFIRQTILNSQYCFIRNGFASIRNFLFAFVYGWMLANQYECLMITTHALSSIIISCDCLGNVAKTIRICFPSEFEEHVPNIRNTTWTTANAYEHLRMNGDHFVIIANCWRIAQAHSPYIRHSLRLASRRDLLHVETVDSFSQNRTVC